MSVSLDVGWDKRGISAHEPAAFKRAVARTLRKAGATALRDMQSEASKRIRQRKRMLRGEHRSCCVASPRPVA